MSTLGRKFEILDRYDAMDPHKFHDLLFPLGEFLLQPKRETIAAAADRVEFATVAGYPNIPIVRLRPEEDRLTSDICQTLYKTRPSAHFVACLTSDGITWSLRSDKDGNNTDVGEIAKANGGGGHRNASGFKEIKNAN